MTSLAILAFLAGLFAFADEPGRAALLVVNNYDGERYAIAMMRDGAPAEPPCDAVWVYAARGDRLYTVIARTDGGRGYHPQICTLAGDTHALTSEVVYDSYAGFGPDGRVLTAHARTEGGIGLLLIDPAAGTAEPVERPGTLNSDPDWSPDGAFWLYRSDRDGRINLWLEDVESGEVRRLTDNQRPLGSRGYGGIGPGRFSPDGRRIAYTCVDESARSQLCLLDLADGAVRQLTQGDAQINAMYPAWRPSGEAIVFGAAASDESGGDRRFSLFEIRLDDGEISPLPAQPAGDNLGAAPIGDAPPS